MANANRNKRGVARSFPTFSLASMASTDLATRFELTFSPNKAFSEAEAVTFLKIERMTSDGWRSYALLVRDLAKNTGFTAQSINKGLYLRSIGHIVSSLDKDCVDGVLAKLPKAVGVSAEKKHKSIKARISQSEDNSGKGKGKGSAKTSKGIPAFGIVEANLATWCKDKTVAQLETLQSIIAGAIADKLAEETASEAVNQ